MRCISVTLFSLLLVACGPGVSDNRYAETLLSAELAAPQKPPPNKGPKCDPGFANCDGLASNKCEVNLTNDMNNCGTCGNVCVAVNNAASVTCLNGQCVVQACNAGWLDCDHSAANGCEVAVDMYHCASCTNVCPATYQCLFVNSSYGCVPPLVIADPPLTGYLTSNSAYLIWSTNYPSTSQVFWGLTPYLGNASPFDSNLVADHVVSIGGLDPSTGYYFQAVSTDQWGRTATSFIEFWSTTP